MVSSMADEMTQPQQMNYVDEELKQEFAKQHEQLLEMKKQLNQQEYELKQAHLNLTA